MAFYDDITTKIILNTDSDKIDETLSDFPVMIKIASDTGTNNGDATDVFDVLEYTPIAISNLTNHYTMDYISGTTLYDKVGSTDGTITNSSVVEGVKGNCLELGSVAGIERNVEFGTAITGWVSISFWMKVHSLTNTAAMFMDTTTNKVIAKNATAAGNTLYVYNSGGKASNLTITDTDWHHVVCVQESSTALRFWLDGVAASATVLWSDTYDVKYIGRYNAASAQEVPHMDQVRFYDKILVESEILELYHEGIEQHQEEVSLMLHFEDGFVDNGYHGHTFTAGGTPTISGVTKMGNTSCYFPGSGDYLSTTDNLGPFTLESENFTIDLWTFIPTGVTTAPFCGKGGGAAAWNSSGHSYIFMVYLGQVYFQYFNGSTVSSMNVSVSDYQNDWVHWAVVNDDTNCTIYQDGTAVKQVGRITITNTTGGTQKFTVGTMGSLDTFGETYIDEFSFVKGRAIWTEAFTPPTSQYTSSYGNRKQIAVTTDIGEQVSLLMHMDDTSLIDSSIHSHTTTLNGDVTRSDTQSKFGGYSAYFDGSADYVYFPDSEAFDLSGDFTIDLHIRFNSVTGNNHFMNRWLSAGGDWYFARIGSELRVGTSGVWADIDTSGAALTTGTWYHIALVHVGTNVKIFVDGVANVSVTRTGELPYTDTGNRRLSIGRIYNTDTDSFAGYIDEVRIIKGTAVWTDEFTPPTIAHTTHVECPVEIERWDHLDEKAILWTKLPTVVSGTSQDIHVYYEKDTLPTTTTSDGNSSFVGDTGEAPAQSVWNDDFMEVLHMNTSPETTVSGSTSDGLVFTPAGSMTDSDIIDGDVSKAIAFDGVDDEFVNASSDFSALEDEFTLETKVKWGNTGTTYERIVQIGPNAAGTILLIESSNSGYYHIGLYADDEQSNEATLDQEGDYHWIAHRMDSSNLVTLSKDGVLDTQTNPGVSPASLSSARITIAGKGAGVEYGTLNLEEFRISKTARSDAWVKASYYSSFDTLLTLETQQEYSLLFSSPYPINGSTVFGMEKQLGLTVSVSGGNPSYTYDADFYDSFDVQIGSTVSGTNSGNQVQSTNYISTASSGTYGWYVTATSSGTTDTSPVYTFLNRFLCSGYAEVQGTRTSGIPVRLYKRDTGQLIGSTTTTGTDGSFNIATDYNEYHYAVALYTDTTTNALINDWLTPSG